MVKSVSRIFILLLLCLITLPYIFTPQEYITTLKSYIPLKYGVISRILTDSKYQYLLFDTKESETKGLDINFIPTPDFVLNKVVNISYKSKLIPSTLMLSGVDDNNSTLLWSYKFKLGPMPWHRIYGWYIHHKVNGTIVQKLNSFKEQIRDLRNIYHADITVTKLFDSTLVTIKTEVKGFPTTKQIYSSIRELEDYSAKFGAKPTNYPMLNIRKKDSTFVFMVALPIDKDLKSTDKIISKRMLPGGKFLVTNELNGGYKKVENIEKYLEDYKYDFGYSSPAIPFQSLITNREVENDTSLWVTKLFYPIF